MSQSQGGPLLLTGTNAIIFAWAQRLAYRGADSSELGPLQKALALACHMAEDEIPPAHLARLAANCVNEVAEAGLLPNGVFSVASMMLGYFRNEPVETCILYACENLLAKQTLVNDRGYPRISYIVPPESN